MTVRSPLPFVASGVILAAVVASFVIVYALCRLFGFEMQPAIVAALIALSLGRGERARHPIWAVPATLLIAPLAAATGWLFHVAPALGAAAFTAALFFSIWLRNFGEWARTAGTLVALPFVAMLVVPPPNALPAAGAGAYSLLVAGAGLIALGCVAATRVIASRAAGRAVSPARPTPPRVNRTATGRRGPPVATRMALQMAIAVGAAFTVGFTLFRGHFSWSVITAFIVCSGSLGRADAVYRGILRLCGAIGGTLVVAALEAVWIPHGPMQAVAIFIALYAGLVLRDLNYAYWAAAITLVLALLAPAATGDGSVLQLLAQRLGAILAGALCAIAATWFVLPIKTEDVIRRRLADALVALDAVVANPPAERPAGDDDPHAVLAHRMRELEHVAAPMRWHRRLAARTSDDHPAVWVEHARTAHHRALTLTEQPATNPSSTGAVRRAIGRARRSIAQHADPAAAGARVTIASALSALNAAFETAPADRLGRR